VAYTSYLVKAALPVNLAPVYPYAEGGWPVWRVTVATLVVGGLTSLAIWQRKRRPYLLMGWLWYLGTLVPVIGLVQVGDQAYADRYTYFPFIGPCLALVWAVAEAVPETRLRWSIGAALFVTLALAAITWRQTDFWKSDFTLWPHTLAATGPNAYAYNTLGTAYETRDGLNKEAIRYYEKAVQTSPGYSPGQYNLGRALRKQKRDAQAAEAFRTAILTDPGLAEAYDQLAKILSEQRSNADAEANFLEALRLKPQSALFHSDYALFLESCGRDSEALAHHQQAVRSSPGDSAVHARFAKFLGNRGDFAPAVEEFGRAAELQPGSPMLYRDLGIALEKAGRSAEALTSFRRAAELAPGDIRCRLTLASALARSGNAAEAAEQYSQASRIDPRWPDELVRQAWLLATHPNSRERDGVAAVRAAESACNVVSPPPAFYLDVLAAACAETGHFAEAEATAAKALAAANAAGNSDLARSIADRLALYRAGQPFHQTPAAETPQPGSGR
jgi:tetratricopeptide (TPR) repeat protein